MRCFIHSNLEALVVCKKCGKGMCVDCSAYSNHSGICPECRSDEYKQELSEKIIATKQIKAKLVKTYIRWVLDGILALLGIIGYFSSSSKLIVLAILGIALALFKLPKFFGNKKIISNLEERIEWLILETDKLDSVLSKGKTNLTI